MTDPEPAPESAPEPAQSVSEAAGEDLPAGRTTAGVVAVGGTATGAISPAEDRDWFAVELAAGRTYTVDLKGNPTGDGTLGDPKLRGIHDAEGNLIAGTTNDDGGEGYNSRLTFTASESGTHYIAAGAYVDDQGTYEVAVTDVTPSAADDDLPADSTTTGVVEVGGTVTGEWQSLPNSRGGDVDWFAVEFEEGKTYRIDLEGSSNGGTRPNPYLAGVYDADGVRLHRSTDDDGGAGVDSRLIFTAAETATHYIGASGQYGPGAYTLSVRDISDRLSDYGLADDYAFGTGTTGTVSVGGSVTGRIDRERDQDWFAVELEAGKTYRIDLEGVWSDVGTLSDPYLRGVYDSNGVLFPGTSDDDGGFKYNSRLYVEATETGTHYVSASSLNSRAYNINPQFNSYRLSVYDVTDGGGPDEYTAGTDTTGRVAVGGSATGLIGYEGDRDWFAVELVAGTVYTVELKGWQTGDGWLIDPYLHGIHDAAGNLINGTEDDNGGAHLNSLVTFEAATTGTYYIAAGSGSWRGRMEGDENNWQGVLEGSYTLSVDAV